MRTWFKIILLISFIPLDQSFAREKPDLRHGTRLGIETGINFHNFTGTDFWGEKLGNQFILGFHAGASAIIPIYGDFFFNPGISFIVKGTRESIINSGVKSEGNDITSTIRLSYIEMPIILLYRPVLGDGHLLAGFGPYIARGVYGNVKTKAGSLFTTLDVKFKNTVGTNDPSDFRYLRGFDAGANILLGYEFDSSIMVQMNAQLGLLKINPDFEALTTDETYKKMIGFGLTFGYRF